MKKVALGIMILLASAPAQAGTGPQQGRCEWITSHASNNLYNICYFFSTIPYKRWLH